MALLFTTYAELQASIGSELNRPELVTDGSIAGFITLAEATLKRKLRRKVSGPTAFTFTSGTNSKALANTVASLRSIAPAVSGNRPRGGKPLTLLSWEAFNEKRAQLQTTGTPRFVAVYNQTVYVAPAPTDSNLDFAITTFDAYVPVASSTTLLLEAPDLLFYGALAHSAPFLEHDERAPMWTAVFTQALKELNERRQEEEFGMSLQAARLPFNAGGGRII